MWKKIVGLLALVGVGFLIMRAVRQYRQDNVFDMAPATDGATGTGTARRSISPELLEILADPADKGPVKLITDGSGKEWLLNPRNGFRYPVEDGIPIMLIEEGEKHRDESLIEK